MSDKCDGVIIHVTSLSGIFLTMMFFRNAKFGGRLFQTKSLSINLVAVSNKILTNSTVPILTHLFKGWRYAVVMGSQGCGMASVLKKVTIFFT